MSSTDQINKQEGYRAKTKWKRGRAFAAGDDGLERCRNPLNAYQVPSNSESLVFAISGMCEN